MWVTFSDPGRPGSQVLCSHPSSRVQKFGVNAANVGCHALWDGTLGILLSIPYSDRLFWFPFDRILLRDGCQEIFLPCVICQCPETAVDYFLTFGIHLFSEIHKCRFCEIFRSFLSHPWKRRAASRSSWISFGCSFSIFGHWPSSFELTSFYRLGLTDDVFVDRSNGLSAGCSGDAATCLGCDSGGWSRDSGTCCVSADIPIIYLNALPDTEIVVLKDRNGGVHEGVTSEISVAMGAVSWAVDLDRFLPIL